MNKVVTSKEAILETSKILIQEQGWPAVNIRSVAAACGVSVGSIYNYFNSKSDLAASVIESIWREIFQMTEQDGAPVECFSDYIQWLFECMEAGSRKYPGFFTFHSVSLMEGERQKGITLMQRSWEHIHQNLLHILLNDRALRSDAFHSGFTPDQLVELVFSLMTAALLREDYDCSALLEVIRRSIYQNKTDLPSNHSGASENVKISERRK